MNGDKLKTIVLFLALLGNAAAWLWGAGGKYAALEYRVNAHDARIDRIEDVLQRLTEQHGLLSRNLEVLTTIVKERTGNYERR